MCLKCKFNYTRLVRRVPGSTYFVDPGTTFQSEKMYPNRLYHTLKPNPSQREMIGE